MMSLNSFSQTVTDSTTIQLTKPVAKLVIKDLIQFDGMSKEVKTLKEVISESNQKINIQDTLIINLKQQVLNFESIINKKEKQHRLHEELTEKLHTDLKKQKFKNKLTVGAGILVAVGVLVLAK